MMEMRFYIPDKEEEEEDAVAGFKEEVMTRANIRTDTGDVIVSFAEIQSLKPRWHTFTKYQISRIVPGLVINK